MKDVSDDLLREFKERMHISHNSEDANLKRMLASSWASLEGMCGSFDPAVNERGRELIFERSRYVYNDSLEFFQTNFLSELHSFSLDLLPYEEEVDGEGESVPETDLYGFVIVEEGQP